MLQDFRSLEAANLTSLHARQSNVTCSVISLNSGRHASRRDDLNSRSRFQLQERTVQQLGHETQSKLLEAAAATPTSN